MISRAPPLWICNVRMRQTCSDRLIALCTKQSHHMLEQILGKGADMTLSRCRQQTNSNVSLNKPVKSCFVISINSSGQV